MSSPLIFISYKHGDPWTRLAKRLHTRLSPISRGMGFRVFMDDKDIKGGDLWSREVETALKETTHFIALLCDEYWLSRECMRELHSAIKRYEKSAAPRVLFVLAEKMRPEFLTFDEARQQGTLTSSNKRIGKVSDVHFLGPFDDNVRLVRLEWNDPAKLGDQFAQLIDRLEATLPTARGG